MCSGRAFVSSDHHITHTHRRSAVAYPGECVTTRERLNAFLFVKINPDCTPRAVLIHYSYTMNECA